jgi:hypothetical protein
MIVEYHVVLGSVGTLVGFLSYGLYFRSIFRGETKPHPFTWFVYAVIDSIVFVIQTLEGAGPGSWIVLASAIGNVGIVLLSYKNGMKNITWSDWASFAAALFGVALWQISSEPLLAIFILTATNVFAVAPTFRKSFSRPNEESITVWAIDIFRFGLGVFALTSLTLTTALFPIGVMLTNASLTAVILVRRYQLRGL